jgi:16S rRNA processing protein RimM
MEVFDAGTGETLGRVAEVYSLPAHDVYVVKGGARSYQIPAVSAFVESVDAEAGRMRVRLIEGMEE